MTTAKVRKKYLPVVLPVVFIALAALTLLLFALIRPAGEKPSPVGHTGGPLLGALYAATGQENFQKGFTLQKFSASADVGYALLSGDVDLGFIEISKLPALHDMEGFSKLTAVGKVTFPYGATILLRKGLSLRLSDLNGHTLGTSSPECVLLKAFTQDAQRLGADLSHVVYQTLPFDAMLPALEAGVVDAVVTKGAYAAAAKRLGHTVLYQNWDVTPGDECCPAIIDQTELILFARIDAKKTADAFLQDLLKAQALSPSQLREAITKETAISADTLLGLPLAEFSAADDALVELLLGHDHSGEDAAQGDARY